MRKAERTSGGKYTAKHEIIIGVIFLAGVCALAISRAQKAQSHNCKCGRIRIICMEQKKGAANDDRENNATRILMVPDRGSVYVQYMVQIWPVSGLLYQQHLLHRRLSPGMNRRHSDAYMVAGQPDWFPCGGPFCIQIYWLMDKQLRLELVSRRFLLRLDNAHLKRPAFGANSIRDNTCVQLCEARLPIGARHIYMRVYSAGTQSKSPKVTHSRINVGVFLLLLQFFRWAFSLSLLCGVCY